MIIPSGSFAVFALNCLQKSMMFTPCGPSAVPTGGAGVAFIAGNCSFTVACTFFAIFYGPFKPTVATFSQPGACVSLRDFFYLREIQLHGCRTSKDGYRN